jgi:hypothetical protein
MLHIKILGLRSQERYALRRLVLAAQEILQAQIPHLALDITEIGDPTEIGRYVQTLVTPSLVVNEKTVCSGRLPTMEEVVAWLRSVVEAGGEQMAGS